MLHWLKSSIALVPLVVITSCGGGSGGAEVVGGGGAAVVGGGAGGVGASDNCKMMLDRELECASPEGKKVLAGGREEALKMCRATADFSTGRDLAELECSKKATCEERSQCMGGLADARGMQQLKEDIEAALKSGQMLDSAVQSCQRHEDKDEALTRMCGELSKKAIEVWTKEIEAFGDGGGGADAIEGVIRSCSALKRLAGTMSADEQARTTALCEDIRSGQLAKDAIEEANASIAAGARTEPRKCVEATQSLGTMTSERAKTRLQEVLKACYIDHGKKLLAGYLAAGSACNKEFAKLTMAVKKFEIKDAELDAYIAKAKLTCGKQGGSPPAP